MTGPLGSMVDDAKPKKPKLYLPLTASARKPGRINLKAVAEVLAERGYDPTEEILKLLDPGVDADGNPVAQKLDADVKARMWNELLQYTQPKLKSVEIKAKIAATTFDVTDEQALSIAKEFLITAVTGDAE